MALSIKPIEIIEQEKHQLLVKAKHWERVDLSNVAIVQNGYAFKSELFTNSGGMPLIRIRDIDKGKTENFYTGDYSEDFVVKDGDFLVGMDGDFNAAVWSGDYGLLNQRVCRLIPITKNFSSKFLFLCLQPFLNAINSETSSVTVKHLSSKTIGEIPLPLPPLPEQHRIVAKIEALFSELDKGIESLKTAQQQLKIYRQALLKHAFSGKLTEAWRAENQDKLETAEALLQRIQTEREQRYQARLKEWETNGKQGTKPKAPKVLPPLTDEELAELPELPTGWFWGKYGDFCSIVRNGISEKPMGDNGTPIFRISAVRALFFDMKDIRYIDNSTGKFDAYCLERGDLVFTRYNGSRHYVGVCAEYRSDEKRLFPDKLVQTRLFSKKLLSSSYFEKALNCGETRKFLESRIRTTAGQSGVSGDDIKFSPVPICSINEQIEIFSLLESKLSITDQLEKTITTALQQSEVLRQSILKKAFSGQLVPQDPNDEPASVLLERIKAEKAALINPVKTVTKKIKSGKKTA
jgi:type I restriction enzyme S subunit